MKNGRRQELKKYHKELSEFRKYDLIRKLHVGKYNNTGVILLRLDLIGDCTMFSSAAIAIRNFYKDRKVTVVCLAISKPIFERLGVFDNIISVDFKPQEIDYRKLKHLILQLRNEQYDLLLQPQVSKYPLADILAAAIKCNKRIAIETKPGNSTSTWINKTNSLYDEFIPYPEGVVSEFDYYGAFVRGIGLPDYKTTCPCLPYSQQNFIEGDYYVIYPGGSVRQKFWPPERFAELMNHVYERTGLTGVFLGVADEQWVPDKIKGYLNDVTAMSIVDLTGKTTIDNVIDIIGNSEFVISNDTSGVHIACATGVPSIVDVGGWHFHRFLPYHIENITEKDKLPLIAYTKMPCYNCEWIWDIVGKRNTECLRRLKCGEPSECIEKITYEQMRDIVDYIIDEEKLD